MQGAVTKNLKHLVTVGRVGAHCSLDVCNIHAFASQQAQLHRMTLLTHQTQISLHSASSILPPPSHIIHYLYVFLVIKRGLTARVCI